MKIHRLKLITLLFCISSFSAFAASLPTTSYTETSSSESTGNDDGSIATPTTEALLGSTTYNVTQGNSNTGTFYTTFTESTSLTDAPWNWYSLTSGLSLSLGDIINITDLNDGTISSYTLGTSDTSGYLTAVFQAGAGNDPLGSYNYFLAAPIGDGNIILIIIGGLYSIFLYRRYKKKKQIIAVL